MIAPLNKRLLIEPIKEQSAFQNPDRKYEEKGVIIAMAKDCPQSDYKVGDMVFFDHWGCSKYEDGGKEIWLVPHEKLTAKKDG